LSNLTHEEIEFFDRIMESATKPNELEQQSQGDDLSLIKSDRDSFQARVIRDSEWAGGERETNHKIYEWPKQEYIESLSP